MRPITTVMFGVNALLLVGSVAWCWMHWRAGVELRAELDPLRAGVREMARLRRENEGLAKRQVAAAELEQLRADHAALERLRKELAGLGERAQDRIRNPIPLSSAAQLPADAGPVRATGEWENKGHDEPAAVFETALWAARHGEVAALARLLAVESEGSNAIKNGLADLPDAARRDLGSTEQFVAAQMAKDFSLASYQVLGRNELAPTAVSLAVRVRSEGGEPRELSFTLLTNSAGWHLLVPRDAVIRYLETFKSAAAGAPGK